jgi:hypothetical protein
LWEKWFDKDYQIIDYNFKNRLSKNDDFMNWKNNNKEEFYQIWDKLINSNVIYKDLGKEIDKHNFIVPKPKNEIGLREIVSYFCEDKHLSET